MATTPALFKARFPEFASLNDPDVQIWIDAVNCQLNKNAYLSTKAGDEAELFMVAHYVHLFVEEQANRVGTSGAASDMSGGDLSISFVAGDPKKENFFSTTKYGQVYNQLSAAVFPQRFRC